VKSLPPGDSSFTAVFRSQSTAPNAFVISSLELVLSPICSLPATGGVPKLLVYPLAAFFWSIPDSTKAESEDHLSGFVLVGAHLSAIISSLCCHCHWFVVCSSSGFGCQVSLQKLRFLCGFLCESLQGDASIALESPDQKTRGFIVQIAFPR
jgi:hypothetical protein